VIVCNKRDGFVQPTRAIHVSCLERLILDCLKFVFRKVEHVVKATVKTMVLEERSTLEVARSFGFVRHTQVPMWFNDILMEGKLIFRE